MFKFDHKIYKIDLDKLMKWVSNAPASERNTISSITQSYPIIDLDEDVPEEALNYSTKEITEHKETLNDTMNNIRYDIIKILLGIILNDVTKEDGDVSLEKSLSFQQKLCLNTLINKGIIIEETEN